MNFDSIFLKFGKLTSNYITKLFTYARRNYEIFELHYSYKKWPSVDKYVNWNVILIHEAMYGVRNLERTIRFSL